MNGSLTPSSGKALRRTHARQVAPTEVAREAGRWISLVAMNKIGRSDHGAGVNRTVISVGSIERSENAAVIAPVAAPPRRRTSSPATVWDRVKRNRAALCGLVVVAVVIGVAVPAPWVTPPDPPPRVPAGPAPERPPPPPAG